MNTLHQFQSGEQYRFVEDTHEYGPNFKPGTIVEVLETDDDGDTWFVGPPAHGEGSLTEQTIHPGDVEVCEPLGAREVRITFTYTLDRDITPAIVEAIAATASVMDVQTEDGIYTAGSKDAEEAYFEGDEPGKGAWLPNEHLADIIGAEDAKVEVVR